MVVREKNVATVAEILRTGLRSKTRLSVTNVWPVSSTKF